MKEILIGIIASMFFAVTFILNRSMEVTGGSWIWSSSLRFIFMFPFFLLIVLVRKNTKQVLFEIKKQPLSWIGWSFVGFVLFYAPITYAAAFGPGWLVAGTWQLTIVAGVLLTPLFFHEIKTATGTERIKNSLPLKSLVISFIILAGVLLIQLQHATTVSFQVVLFSMLPVVVAAFAYPLGNRKMMELCGGRLDTFQRVFGMTLATLPFWLVLAVYGLLTIGPPSSSQLLQAFIVAVSSGVIATTLFFIATDRVHENPDRLAAVEATQSAQVLFVLLGEMWLLASPFPSAAAIIGLLMIMAGMLAHSYLTKKPQQQRSASS
ncbi:multidrug resistance efflux transporter family protein [Alkalihalobacillus oceani]|uniref:DMT family transporter n=1 Tax=Halalkalibacter oceani TaxID=1653776 RepID=UPI00204154A4|nr:multidrug resistance efflux transporter family protein [Halalkalibacter oceani]MCM3760562.1 multidrug resistance efflux transporter family protein [Halalkalibacter oceani]